jgi:hypothetical protein
LTQATVHGGSVINFYHDDVMSKMVLTRLLALGRSRARYRTALGYVLVFLIVYGATVGAAHSHGGTSRLLPGVTSISDAGESPSSDTGHSQHRECSMCQFQRQLFGGFFHAPVFERTPLAEIAFDATPTSFYPSTSTTAPSGRAPPLVTS